MQALDKRKQSFEVRKGRKGSGWPHPAPFLANPTSLAEAGFFFEPIPGSKDRVTCYMCGKSLGDWEKEDDPFLIHAQRSPDCGWAMARCGVETEYGVDGRCECLLVCLARDKRLTSA